MSNSNNSNSTAKSGGIGFLGLLTIVFITLKLTGYIDWPWLRVLAPLWVPAIVWIGVVIIAFLVIGAITWYQDRQAAKRHALLDQALEAIRKGRK